MADSQGEEDVVTKTSTFMDKNLKIIRTGTWILAGAGVLIIVRRAYLMRWFRKVTDIPDEFISKGISIRGQIKSITPDNTLQVLHQPLIKTPAFKKHDAASSSNLLPLSLAGVDFRPGSNSWLKNNLINSYILFVPLGKTLVGTQMPCTVYRRRKYLPTKVCINEEIVRHGLAVAGHTNKPLESNHRYKQLFSRLLRAEAYAQNKSRGIWTKPPLMDRIKAIIRLPTFLRWRKNN